MLLTSCSLDLEAEERAREVETKLSEIDSVSYDVPKAETLRKIMRSTAICFYLLGKWDSN